jgi:hypothetical protein
LFFCSFVLLFFCFFGFLVFWFFGFLIEDFLKGGRAGQEGLVANALRPLGSL